MLSPVRNGRFRRQSVHGWSRIIINFLASRLPGWLTDITAAHRNGRVPRGRKAVAARDN